jgi:iron(III) transport system permease protein
MRWVAALPRRGSRRGSRRFDIFAIVAWPLVLALLVLILYPLAKTFYGTFVVHGSFNFSALDQVVHDELFRESAENTGILLLTGGTGALIVGSLFAWLTERTDASFGIVSRLTPLVPLVLPPVALAIGWLFLAQNTVGYLNGYLRGIEGWFGVHPVQGPLNIASWPGLIFVYIIALVPYAYLVVSPALRNMDGSLEEASRMSGAGPVRTALRIALPSIRPALVSASLLIVIIGTSMYSIPVTIGTEARISTIAVYIVQLTQDSASGFGKSVSVALLLVAFLSTVWFAQRRYTKTGRQAMITGKSASAAVVKLGKWKWVARGLMILYLLCVSVLPFIALLIVALQPYWQADIVPSQFTDAAFHNFFFSPGLQARAGFENSIKLGLIGATMAMAAAGLLAVAARQIRGGRGAIISGVTKIPAAVSNLVVGVAFLVALGGAPFHLAGSLLILLLAYLVIFMPQASVAAEVARGQVDEDLIEASAMLGASRSRTSIRILWPLMRPGLVYGWAMIFVLVTGDLTAAAILSGPSNPVVGTSILAIFTSGTFSDLAVIATVICVVSLLVIGLAITLVGAPVSRRRRRMGRTSGAASITGGGL